MKHIEEYFFCSPRLLQNVDEVKEVFSCVEQVEWQADFEFDEDGKTYENQTGYNMAFKAAFKKLGWQAQPLLLDNPRLIGDFQKDDVFVEIQFGNGATLYRDYYKFHYGLTHNLLALAVLIVPTAPKKFFPTRPSSVNNMAEYALAERYFKLLPIPVPILLIGLLPEN